MLTANDKGKPEPTGEQKERHIVYAFIDVPVEIIWIKRGADGPKATQPCPFCGSTLLEADYDGADRRFVRCACGARGPTHEDDESAIYEWNQRAIPPGKEVEKQVVYHEGEP